MHTFNRSNTTRRRARGFALVVTLLLMVLLTLVAVGLLQLSAISLRTTSHGNARAIARGNAMVALQMAVAQLQRTAGQDQRITAPASFASAEYPVSWTGVWTPGVIDGEALTPSVSPIPSGRRNYLTDARAKAPAWKSDLFLEPLVSPESPDAAKVEMGRWSESETVSVPEVKVGDDGGLAWWTEDVSQQASLASGVNAGDAVLVGLNSAPRADSSRVAEGVLPVDYFSHSDDRRKVASLQTAYVAGKVQPKGLLGDTGTARSYGLFTDPVKGGFKADLTRFVESDSDVMGKLADFGLAGIFSKTSLLPGTQHTRTGPQWARLRNWHRMPVTEGGKLAAATPETLRQASAAYCGEGYSLDAVRSNSLPLNPMVVDAGFHWDFTPVTAAATSIRVHIYPRLTLWNPYNTTLTGKRYVIVMPRHIDSGGGLTVEMESATGAALPPFTAINGWGEQFNVSGQASENYFMFTVEPTSFGPGECLVFTPRTAAGSLSPYNATNPAANVLTASQPVGPENFYIDKTPNASGETIARRIAQGYRVKRYSSGDTNWSNIYLNWNPKPFLLKAAPDSGSLSATQVLTSRSYPTLQRLYVNDGGAGSNYFDTGGKSSSYVQIKTDWNNEAVNNGSPWGTFSTSRRPPRNWYYRVHMAWIDDDTELASVPAGVATPEPPYASATFADWNPLASVVCRTPSTYMNEPFDLHVGNWYRCKAAYDAFGTGSNWSVFAGGKARGCPYGDPRNHGSKLSFPLIDVPSKEQPLQSIGTLRNAPLSPWAWHPAKPLGSSRPSLHSDKDSTAIPALARQSKPWDATITQKDRVFDDIVQSSDSSGEMLLYDIAYETNRAMWDSTFASSWSRSVDWDGVERLPNRQYVANPAVGGAAKVIETARTSPEDYGLWLPAYLLASEGAFNVNSISPTAWAAVLGGLRKLERTDAGGDVVGGDHPFARFLHPASDDKEWGGGLGLSDPQIAELSTRIVEVVKERGPFLGMADFVNRRLATDATGDRGALDEALIRANLANPDLSRIVSTPNDRATKVLAANRGRYENVSRRLMEGAAGYIEQADLLEPLAGSLAARGDTFRIRASGACYDTAGKLLSRVTCEAIVVRSPEYLNAAAVNQAGDASSGNSALVPPMVASGDTLVPNPALHPDNRKFGRRFEILSIKWLADTNEA